MSEEEFVELGDWKSLCFDSRCMDPRHGVKMSERDLKYRWLRCRDVAFANATAEPGVPENCSYHNPPCEIRCFLSYIADEVRNLWYGSPTGFYSHVS